MNKQTAALYCRISRDDANYGDSSSIETQKSMLSNYAETNGFEYEFYIDDGYSGTSFDRPGFNQMISDIQDKKINIVITKDLSRLGRDYLKTGYYIELYFDENDVRYIALNDGVDSINGENEFIPFKNIINEWHSRDLSRKVKSAYRTKTLKGEYTAAFAPYGYLKDPDNKHHLIVDEETATVVKLIFQMAIEGLSPFKIAKKLSGNKILTPRAYLAHRFGKYKNCFSIKYPEDWSNSTIMSFLQNREYLGHTLGNKSTTKSFKNRKQIAVPETEWIETKHTHPALIDEHTFYLAQKVVSVKKRKNTSTTVNIFAGLLKCSDCGSSLGFVKGKSEGHNGAYNCNLYRKKSSKYCTAHYITYKTIYQIVLDDIRRHVQNIKQYQDELRNFAVSLSTEKTKEKLITQYNELEKSQQRYNDLNIIMKKTFEHNALGNISDEKFLSLWTSYEAEQKQLSVRIEELNSEIDQKKDNIVTLNEIDKIIEKLINIKTLTAPILNELIQKIVISNSETIDEKKTQKIDIYYNFSI